MKRFFQLLAASLGGGLVAAYCFTSSLEPEMGMTALFYPAVFPIATVGGLFGGLLVFPVLFFCLKDKQLRLAVPVLYGLVALVIFLSSFFLSALGTIIVSFVFSVLLLIVIRFATAPAHSGTKY